MSYDSDLRAKAVRIWQKCQQYQQVLEKGGNQITPEQHQEMANWAQIPYLFEPFAQLPDPDAGVLVNMLNDLHSALAELSDGQILPSSSGKPDAHGESISPVGDMSHMNISTDLVGWTGNAARNFESGFIQPFPYKVQSQFVAVYVLVSAVKGYQAVWRAARADTMKIADKTLEALEHHCHFGGGGAAMALTVIGAVAAVGTALVEGPVAPAVLLLEVVSAGAGVGAAGAGGGGDSQKLDVSGADAFTVVPKLRAALETLKKAIVQKQDDVYKVLSGDLSQLEAGTDKLIPNKPELATGTRGNIKDLMGHAS
ncbi:hypothetical protein [Hamadaea tsunoensis]|uniref:hypothetical protein n=1 Tax=Hamadaea tsunoensis TaxID=53368 RepID=UPI0003FDE3CA|nr:hypothetical protein [Hamadaea tsunoensis]